MNEDKQELEEQDEEQGHDSPEEQEGTVRHPMRQKSGWLRRKLRRWRGTDDMSKNTSSADNIYFNPPVQSQENAHSPGPDTGPRLPHARRKREP